MTLLRFSWWCWWSTKRKNVICVIVNFMPMTLSYTIYIKLQMNDKLPQIQASLQSDHNILRVRLNKSVVNIKQNPVSWFLFCETLWNSKKTKPGLCMITCNDGARLLRLILLTQGFYFCIKIWPGVTEHSVEQTHLYICEAVTMSPLTIRRHIHWLRFTFTSSTPSIFKTMSDSIYSKLPCQTLCSTPFHRRSCQ